MTSESNPISGYEASLRANGIARYFAVAFLLVWLAGWVVGEVFAIGFLAMILRSVIGAAAGMKLPMPGAEWVTGGAAAFAIVFLLFWLTLWTFGGIAAITEVLRNLGGEDRILIRPTGIELLWRAGPFHRTYTYERADIRRIRLRRARRELVIDTASGTHVLTKFGSIEERNAIIEWLKRHLSLPGESDTVDANTNPSGWSVTTHDGAARMMRGSERAFRIAAIIAWTVVLATGMAWYGSLRTDSVSWGALVVTAMLAAGAAWLTWARNEWIVRTGQLTHYRRFATWESERRFMGARFEVEASRDSDNDNRYKLIVRDGNGKSTISTAIHDDADVVALGRWLAARTGFPLTLPGQSQL